MISISTLRKTAISGLVAGALAGPLAAQDGPFPPDAWPASADGDKLVHFVTTDDPGLGALGGGWQQTLTILSGGDQVTLPITIGGFDALQVAGNYLNVADSAFSDWNDHAVIDVLVQIYGNDAVLGQDGNPRNYAFLTGTLPELNFPVGGSIPVEGKNNEWNWVLFRIDNAQRPGGGGRHVGFVPAGQNGPAGGVNGGTIRVEAVPGWIVRAVAFGEEGAFGEPDQVNRFVEPEVCAPEPATNHAFIDIASETSEHMVVLSGGDQVSTIVDGVGPDGDKRRAVRAEGQFLNFGVTDNYLGEPCSEPRTLKICIEYYDDPAMEGSFFGPEAYATDDEGGTATFDRNKWFATRGSGEWVRQAFTIPPASLFGVNTTPLTGGVRLAFDPDSNVYISRFDLAVLRVGDHPLAGVDPLEDCFEDPAVCAGDYGFYAEMDLDKGVFDGLGPGSSGGDQVMIEEEAGPVADRRMAVRAAHDDGPAGFNHNYVNLAILNEVFGPTSQPLARLAICVTYWDNPDLVGAFFRPEVYRTIRNGVEIFAFVPNTENVVLEGTDTWREAYFEIPNMKFSGVNQGPQAAARFLLSDKIHFTRVRYGVIRDCGPTAGINPLEDCGKPLVGAEPPSLSISRDGANLVFEWGSQGGLLSNLRSETDPSSSDPANWPIFEGNQDIESTPPTNTLTIPLPADPSRYFVIEQFPAPPVAIFSDDFESGLGSWTTGSDGADGTAWELGPPSNVGPTAASSPPNCIGTNLMADYGLNANVWLRSPPIDLTLAGGATLHYAEFKDIEEFFDAGSIRILDASDDSELAVIDSSIDGATADWERVSELIPVGGLGSIIKIEFRFSSDDIGNFSGWYLDDVEVTVP